MPRPPKYKYPIRRVREATGLSQKAFAELVGASLATIQSVELGRLHVSDDLARKVMTATGAALADVTKRKGHPRDVHGRLFDEETFRQWRHSYHRPRRISGDLEDVSDSVISAAKTLLDIAMDEGELMAVAVELGDAIIRITRKYGFEADFLERASSPLEQLDPSALPLLVFPRPEDPDDVPYLELGDGED